MSELSLDDNGHVSLCEALDRILNKGAVVIGEVTISVADIDLLYLELRVILTSIETMREAKSPMWRDRLSRLPGSGHAARQHDAE